MKPSYANTDFTNVSVKARGRDMCLADFIADGVEDCPICGSDELDFWSAFHSFQRPLSTGQYLCPKCHGICMLLGYSPEKGSGRGLLQVVRSAKKNWNAWAKKMRKDKQSVAEVKSYLEHRGGVR